MDSFSAIVIFISVNRLYPNMDEKSIYYLMDEGLKQGKIKPEDGDFFIEALQKTSISDEPRLLPGYVGVHFGLDGWWHHHTHRTSVVMPRGVILNREFKYNARTSEKPSPRFKIQISSLDEYMGLMANKEVASVINSCPSPYSLLIRIDRAVQHEYDLIVPGISGDAAKLEKIASWAAGTRDIIRF